MRNSKDFWPGIIYIGFGTGAIIIARDYKMGTALQMGPAYFPVVISGLLVTVGIISLLRSFIKEGSPVGSFAFKGMLLVTVSTILFGLTLRGGGLIIALPLSVIVSAYASHWFKWRHSIMLAAGITVFCLLVFIKGLGVPIPVVGSWFGR